MIKQLTRLNQIAESLSNTEHALALLALGSVGVEQERIDEYSDLDFFVICKEGFKPKYLENLDWLERIHPIAFSFQNTLDGFKTLYEDDIFCEFAVFEPHEMKHIKFSKGRIVWKRDGFDVSILEATVKEKNEKNDTNYLVNEALTNLYIGLGRYHRGEKLSAYYFIQNNAFDCVLHLMSMIEKPKNDYADLFTISRRFEQRFPDCSNKIPDMLLGYSKIVKTAEKILIFLDENFNVHVILKQKIMNLIKK